MAAGRPTYHHGDLRAAMLEEAPRMIAAAGVDGFSIRALARQLHVSHGAAYRHFASREDLLAALALEGHRDFATALTRGIGRKTQLDTAIKAAALTHLRWAMAHPAEYQVMFGPRLNEAGTHPELEAAIEASFAAVDRIFAGAGASPRRARELNVALMTQLHGYCELVRLRRIRVRDEKTAETYLAKILSPFITGVCAELS